MEQEDRYARHKLIDWWDQDRMRTARVMVLGAGAIGNEVIKLLALMGVGQIVIVDFDRIERSNLTRSVLFRDSDVGEFKAVTAACRAHEINPEIEPRALVSDLEFDIGLGIYEVMDVVISCLDSVGARLAANRACRRMGTTLLNGGIEATFSEIGLYSGREGPCYQCFLPEGLWERQAEHFSCTGLRADVPPDRTPTTAVVAAVTAGYLVHEALYLLHTDFSVQAEKSMQAEKKEGLAFGQKIYLTFKPYGFYVQDLPCEQDCLAHERWEPIEVLDAGPSELTAASLLTGIGEPDAELMLDFDLLLRMRCVRCDEEELVMRPLARCSEGLNRCERCEAETRRPETISRMAVDSEFAHWSLDRIGIPIHQVLEVKHNGRRRFIQIGGVYR